MIRSYIANLQIRLQMVQNCIGGVQNYKEQGIKQVRAKTSEFISKLHKDTQRRFQKIKKTVEKYGDILDLSTTPKQKLQIVTEDLQELKQITTHLDSIQKYLPALNTDTYIEIREQGRNIQNLMTASEIQAGQVKNSIKVKKYDQKSLLEVRNQHRQEMNQLLQLNKRIVNNLNSKIQQLMRKANK